MCLPTSHTLCERWGVSKRGGDLASVLFPNLAFRIPPFICVTTKCISDSLVKILVAQLVSLLGCTSSQVTAF